MSTISPVKLQRSLSPEIGEREQNIVNSGNRPLRSQQMHSQAELEAEQDTVFSLKRKVITLENERLNVLSNSNEEVMRLSSEIARLTAQVEKGEAVRQNLEYELAKTKKEVLLEKKATEDCEIEIQKLTDEFKRKEDKLMVEKKNLAQELDASRAVNKDETSRFTSIMQEKEKQMAGLLKERDRLASDKKELLSNIQDRDREVSDLKSEIERHKTFVQESSSDLRLKTFEADQFREKVNMVEQELYMTLNKIESLESAKEAERISHLQTKYNCELLQNELKAEKSAKAETLVKLERLQEHTKQLQMSYEEEKMMTAKLQDKLAMMEKDLESVNKHLAAELADKKRLVKTYSQQLEEHQKTVSQQKLDISKAKKRQMQLDETCSTGIRELQEILCLCQKNDSTAAAPNLNREPVNIKTFCSLVSSVRQVFNESRQKQEKLTRDLSSQQMTVDQLTKECKAYKVKLSSSAKACELSADALEKSRSDQKQLEIQCRHLEEECCRLQKDLATMKNSIAEEQAYSQELRDQVVKVSVKHKNDEQTSSTFVQLLHQLLNTVDAITMVTEEPGSAAAGLLPKWNDLGLVVNEQVSSLITLLNQEKEKVSRSEELLRQNEKMLQQLYVVHDEELAKMAKMYESANQQWATEKEDLQKQYAKKLNEIQSKHKVSAEETWQHLETASGFQHELEQEHAQLQSRLHQCCRENDTLLATCSLLCGTIYPLHARSVALIEQRNVLCDQLIQFISFKDQVTNLILALSADDAPDGSRSSQCRPRLASRLRFRAVVIVVMAVRRLADIASDNCRTFTSYNILPGVYSTVVCCGNIVPGRKTVTGSKESTGSVASRPRGTEGLVDWMTSADLLSVVQSSMDDLLTAVCRLKEGAKRCIQESGVYEESSQPFLALLYDQFSSLSDEVSCHQVASHIKAAGYDNTRIVNIAKNCFQKFLTSLPNMFPSILVESDRDLSFLKEGLETSLSCYSLPSHSSYAGSQLLSKALQQELLNFTQRLHATELERRDLRAKVSHLKQDVRSSSSDETSSHLKSQLDSLRDQLERTVSLDKFSQVCDELARALEREEQMQAVLQMQKEQLDEQAERLDTLKELQTDHELTDSGKNLLDIKAELRSKDQLVQRMTRQISVLDDEKTSLLKKIKDAERALHTAAKDKQSVISYANTLANWFKKLSSAHSLADDWQVDTVLGLELPNSKPGADLLAVRSLVAAFVEAQNYVLELRPYPKDQTGKSQEIQRNSLKLKGKTDYPEVKAPSAEVAAHHSRPSVVAPPSTGISDQEPFRPLVVDMNSTATNVKENLQVTKVSQKKPTDRKTKSKLPRHLGLRTSTRKPASHRYSSTALASESGGGAAAKPSSSSNVKRNS